MKNCLLFLKIVAFSTGRDKFTIEKILGEGSYAKVFKAIDMGAQRAVALKIQKPRWEWEFYICHQLQSRLSDPLSVS
jgi:checkpoint serine/threonine-protein kinase